MKGKYENGFSHRDNQQIDIIKRNQKENYGIEKYNSNKEKIARGALTDLSRQKKRSANLKIRELRYLKK